jgi:AmiR/NasT family two-component response regulator
MTAHDNPQWQERAEKAGSVAYLRKPFGERSLLEAIQLACRKGASTRKIETGMNN